MGASGCGQPPADRSKGARIYRSRRKVHRQREGVCLFSLCRCEGHRDFHDGEITLRFKLARPAGSVRGHPFQLEVKRRLSDGAFQWQRRQRGLWTFNKGKRSFVKRGSENVKLAMNEWNVLRLRSG